VIRSWAVGGCCNLGGGVVGWVAGEVERGCGMSVDPERAWDMPVKRAPPPVRTPCSGPQNRCPHCGGVVAYVAKYADTIVCCPHCYEGFFQENLAELTAEEPVAVQPVKSDLQRVDPRRADKRPTGASAWWFEGVAVSLSLIFLVTLLSAVEYGPVVGVLSLLGLALAQILSCLADISRSVGRRDR
ncbi:MAG TPA: hypothetical protein VM487_00550, partial [Phycisphaerae bacterium]|nr:hypothetical protein [Phycisphaerae bacterium]